MKGMDLSRAYCERYAASLFAGGLEGLRQRCALGLVGPGSECLGFDDEISRDHDFGPGFCIWLEPPTSPPLERSFSAATTSCPVSSWGIVASRPR